MRQVIHLGLCLLLNLALFGQSSDLLVREAQEDLGAGRDSQAEAELSRVLKAEPTNWKLWCDLGSARVQRGENGAAIEAFETAHHLAPQEAPAYFGLGLVYMKQGNIEKALEAYRGGLTRDANNLAANQNYALLLMQKNDFRDAVEPLRKLKSLGHDDASTRATLIEACLRAGMKSEAEDEINQFLSGHLASVRQELGLAKLLLADAETRAAEEVLRHAKATWPEEPEPHSDLGLLFMQAQQYDTAVRELGRAAQLDPGSAKYALALGEALLRWRHDPVALQYLLAVRQKFGNLPLYKFELGLAYFYLTQFPLALQQFESLAQEQPKSSRIQYLLGGSYEAMAELEKAEDCYRKAIELKPDEPSYYVALASLLKKIKPADLSEPARLVQKALALNPEDKEGRLLLASCYEAQGNLVDAQKLLEALITTNPDSRAAHVALAKVYFREKRMDEAEHQKAIAETLETREQNEVSPWGPGGVGHP